MNLLRAAASLVLLFGFTTSFGQKPSLQLLAGAGIGGAVSRSTTTRYSILVLPRVSAGLRIPLTGRIAVLTGVDLQQKGFRSSSRLNDDKPGDYTVVDGRVRYDQLHIPLQVSVELVPRKSFGLELAAGMSYGFMLRARTMAEWDLYRRNRLTQTGRYEMKSRIALMPYDNRVGVYNSRNYGALYLFNPALAASLTLRARQRVLIQAYGEYNLYDASTVSVSPLNVYSFGLALGYRI